MKARLCTARFDYERGGTILVTAHTTSATGSLSFVHYLITLDGREYEELSRGPSRSTTMVAARKIDDSNIDVTFSRDGNLHLALMEYFERVKLRHSPRAVSEALGTSTAIKK